MEIGNQIPVGAKSSEQKSDLRSGQVVTTTIKERLSDQEAIVSVRGKEVHAVFEGKVPPEGSRALVEIRDTSGQSVAVRVVEESPKMPSGASNQLSEAEMKQIAQSMGERLTPELRQALQVLAEARIPLSREVINEVRGFIEKHWDANRQNASYIQSLNSLENKLDTLKTALAKHSQISQAHLVAIHEALYGSTVADSLQQLQEQFQTLIRDSASALGSSYRDHELLQTMGNLRTKDFLVSVVTKKMAEVGNEFRDLRKELTRNLDNIGRLLETGARNSSQLALRMIEPTIQMLDKTLLKSDMLLFTDMKTEKILMKASSQMAEARSLLEAGKQQEAAKLVEDVRNSIANLKWQPTADRVQRFVVESQKQLEYLRQPAEQQLSQALDRYSLPVNDQTSGREIYDLLRGLGLNHESEVAQRLVAQLSDQANVQQTSVQQQMSARQGNTPQVATDGLNSMLQNLTPQERELLQALVTKITDDIQSMLNKQGNQGAQDQTASTRLAAQTSASIPLTQLFAQLLNGVRQGENVQPILQELQTYLQAPKTGMSPEIQHKFEQLQKIFDRNTWENLQATSRSQEEQFSDNRHNLKSLLLEWMKSGQLAKGGGQQAAEQTMTQLTGQQLLGKFDGNSAMQSMILSLPVILKEQVENIKVFVNGKSKADKIDWENCSLYFLMDTKKIGETGIQIAVANRRIAVTVKNDTHGVQRLFAPHLERFTNQLGELGYHMQGVKFAPLSEPTIEKNKQPGNVKSDRGEQTLPTSSSEEKKYAPKRGFDFKI